MTGESLGDNVSSMGLSCCTDESLSLPDRRRAGTRNNGEMLEDRWESEKVSTYR